jgi:hypothetical protein
VVSLSAIQVRTLPGHSPDSSRPSFETQICLPMDHGDWLQLTVLPTTQPQQKINLKNQDPQKLAVPKCPSSKEKKIVFPLTHITCR